MRKIYVIGCCSQKLSYAAPAAKLYVSPLFTAALTYARMCASDDDIRVLSAKHGLIRLDEVIEPYNVTIGDPDAVRAFDVSLQISEKLHDGRVELVLLCANKYTTLLLDAYREARREHAEFHAPLRGLGIGSQAAWLRREAEAITVSQTCLVVNEGALL